MSEISTLLARWNTETSNLPWGVAQTFRDTFQMVADGKVKLVYGANDYMGSPCLVNAVGNLVSESAPNPSKDFPEVVSLFDQLCMAITVTDGLMECSGFVSGLAADVLLANFASQESIDAKKAEALAGIAETNMTAAFIEPPDSDYVIDFTLDDLDANRP